MRMLPELITVRKSVSCRLDEYQKLLDDVESSTLDMVETWASIFEDLAIIGVNWQALWVLTEEYCEKYNLLYPTAVIVNVNDFIWDELMANVSVMAVQEDIVIPSQLNVPLIDIHPIKDQDYDETELLKIEDWLDKCRYFFKNLWYPWDGNRSVTIMDWCKNHLENRLYLQSDLKSGVFDKTIVHYLKSLMFQAQNFISMAGKWHPEVEDEKLTAVKQLIHIKLLETELDLFENPELRHGMILLKTKEKLTKKANANNKCPDPKELKVVWTGGDCDSLMDVLNYARQNVKDNVKLNVYKSLQDALEASFSNDLILLPSGNHIIKKFNGVYNGGLIKGLSECDTVISPDTSSVPRAILFDCFGVVQMENLTLHKPVGIAIQVYDGIVRLSNVKLTSSGNSTTRGIVVVAGCKLFLENCELDGFGIGIALQKGTEVSLLNTRIVNCVEGIKITDETTLTMNSVEISSCSTYGIRIESSRLEDDESTVGDLNLLKRETVNCSLNDITLANNKKGDVLLMKMDAVLALFDDSSCGDSSNEDDTSDVICLDDTEDGLKNNYLDCKKIDLKGEDNNDDDDDLDDIRITFEKAM